MVNGDALHHDTAVEVCLNGGRDRMPSQSRFKRFQGHKQAKISLNITYCDHAADGNCKILSVGDRAWFLVKRKIRKTETEIVKVRGKLYSSRTGCGQGWGHQ